MSAQIDKAARFLALHVKGQPLLMPNPWDPGSARILVSMGYTALATTSSGAAASAGKLDGGMTRDAVLTSAAAIVEAVDVPVSGDFENCFADDAIGVADTVVRGRAIGLAGCSIEDYDPVAKAVYPFEVAVERVTAAAEAAQGFVLTARAENHLRGHDDLADTIARLQAYQAAGASALFAPGVTNADDIRSIVTSVDLPVNVLASAAAPNVAELAALGVARISTGGAFAYAAYAGLISAATELRDGGTYGFWAQVAGARDVVRGALLP